MAGKRDEIRQELTLRILKAAEKRIKNHGLEALRARDITNDAGCGLGTIYKCFSDLDDVIIHVNSLTLARLKKHLNAAVKDISTPLEVLKALAIAYLDFAERNHQLWTALFKHVLPEGQPIPEWHRLENEDLLMRIERPVSALEPELDQDALAARSRTYFAAIHGIVTIALEDRFIGLDKTVLRSEITHLVERMAAPR